MNPLALELNEVISNKSETIFSLLSKKGKRIYFPKKGILAQAAEAKGKKINATIGEAVEDDGTPMRLPSIEKGVNLKPAQVFPYAPSFGRPDLREKWKALLPVKNPSLAGKEISLPVVSSALTHGLSIIGYLFLDDEDKLLLPDIYWDNYELVFANGYGATLDCFNLFSEGSIDLEAIKHKLNTPVVGKKVLLLNFPNNPTGYTPRVDEVKALVNIIKESADKGNRIVVIIDDAYFGLVYEEGIEKESIFSYLADLHDNVLAVKLDGPTKEDYVWGFRVGFITYGIKHGTKELYTALEAKTAGAIRGNISNAANLSQSLLLNAYESESYPQEKAQKFDILKTRYEAVKEALKKPEYAQYFEPLPYNSGYFMCVKLKGELDGEVVRQILLKDFETGLIYIAGVLRIAYSSVSKEKIQTIFDNIYQACQKASAQLS